MRERDRQFTASALAGALCALVLTGWARPARGEAAACELCIEHSPANTGTITPDTGTHRFSPNSVVTLSANPRPGYQFAYWIGDVSDPKSQSTTVQLNTSKIVVAVFKPVPQEELDRKVSIGGGGGGGALVPTRLDFSSPSFSVSGGGGGRTRQVAVPVIVTPEPASALLLGLGGLALRRRRR